MVPTNPFTIGVDIVKRWSDEDEDEDGSIEYWTEEVRRREQQEEQIIIINTELTFKSDECLICLTNPPNVLFCNCGHITYMRRM